MHLGFRMKWFASLWVSALLCASAFALSPAQFMAAADEDPDGCPDITAYMQDLHALTDEIYATYSDDEEPWTPDSSDDAEEVADDDDPLSASPEDLQLVSDAYQAYADG